MLTPVSFVLADFLDRLAKRMHFIGEKFEEGKRERERESEREREREREREIDRERERGERRMRRGAERSMRRREVSQNRGPPPPPPTPPSLPPKCCHPDEYISHSCVQLCMFQQATLDAI